jgi:hypothetical protein
VDEPYFFVIPSSGRSKNRSIGTRMIIRENFLSAISVETCPKRCIKSAVRIPPHPALSPGIGGEGKGEGEIRDEDGIHRR